MSSEALLLKQKNFIEKIQAIHGEKYDYSLCNFVRRTDKVKLICPLHGIFEKNPQDLLLGQGCQKCSSDKLIRTQENFIKLSLERHGDRYNYSKVCYDNPYSKVEIICLEHGPFMQDPYNHLRGQGCEMCARELKAFEKRFTLEEFIERSKQIHGDLYNYSNTKYKRSTEKIIIICPIHGEFKQVANSHLLGMGCKKCVQEQRRLPKNEFLKRCYEIHKSKYNYDLVEYNSLHDIIKISCPEHGLFEQIAQGHLNGQGCRICGFRKQGESARKGTEQFIKEANLVHSEKYDYSISNYTTINEYVDIICSSHGIFKQTPGSHLSGAGCPKCFNSRGENQIERFLKEYNIQYLTQHKFPDCKDKSLLIFDFYLPSKKIIIEFDGKQHFESVEFFGGEAAFKQLKRRDEIKTSYCKEKNINLIRIRYDENVQEKLTNIFINV